jgi:hypothetical protein
MGKNHSKSPFESMYAANNMTYSSIEKKAAPVKAAQPAPKEEKK